MLLSFLLAAVSDPKIVCGKVLDFSDKQPVYSAMVYTKKDTVWTNLDGSFQIRVDSEGYTIQCLGFQKVENPNPENGQAIEIRPAEPCNVRIIKK